MPGTTRRISQCPICDAPLKVTELSCSACETRLHGVFEPAPLAQIAPEHQRFIETFLLCRGVIRDVERALGVSYPTVRARLDAAVAALETALTPASLSEPPQNGAARPQDERRRREILQRVAEGELDASEAADLLRRLAA